MISRIYNWLIFNKRLVREILKGNSVLMAIRVVMLHTLGVKKSVQLMFMGHQLSLRTSTPDFFVAMETLGHEFDALKDLEFEQESIFIVDAGAYIGTASLALKRLFPKSTIVAIEPSSDNFECLKENVSSVAGIYAYNTALVPADGPSDIFLNEDSAGPWGLSISTTRMANSETVKTVSFQKILDDFNLPIINVCKMDIEGAELELLKKPQDWLDLVDVLVIELHERRRSGIEAAFRDACQNRFSLPLPGEKVLSFSNAFLGAKAKSARHGKKCG